jgi:hypothetical protein
MIQAGDAYPPRPLILAIARVRGALVETDSPQPSRKP